MVSPNRTVRRWSVSFGRNGWTQVQDKILDHVTALVILYRLDRSELTYRRATRAVCMLGMHTEWRLQHSRR